MDRFQKRGGTQLSYVVFFLLLFGMLSIVVYLVLSRTFSDENTRKLASGDVCDFIEGQEDKTSFLTEVNVRLPGDAKHLEATLWRDGTTLVGQLNTRDTVKRIVAYPKYLRGITSSHDFLMPYTVDYGGSETQTYLGLFMYPHETTSEGCRDYHTAQYVDAYALEPGVILDEIIVETYGWHEDIEYGIASDLVRLRYRNTSEEQEFPLRLYHDAPYFAEDESCEHFGNVTEHVRGDGQAYSVCIWPNGNQCAQEMYDRRNCPREGYDISSVDTDAKAYAIIHGLPFNKDGTVYVSADHERCEVDNYYAGLCGN